MMSLLRPIMDSENRPAERRILRQLLPRCEQCASADVHVALRVDRFLYLRGGECFCTWSVPKAVPAWVGLKRG